MGRLNGKMAVVLGAAGRGDMGQVIAQRFRDEDAQVVVSGWHMNELERFAAETPGRACNAWLS
jgi:2-hydroxycyclohexanecarboxyl-CoA dehydrogenase